MAEELDNYAALVKQLKQEIQSARIKASLTINEQLLILNWKLGKAILDQQEKEGWGTKIIESISIELKKAFPTMKGLSTRNLKYMKTFADAYPQFVQIALAELSFLKNSTQSIEKQSIIDEIAIGQQLLPNYEKKSYIKEEGTISGEMFIGQQAASQLPWFHICTILEKAKNQQERWFYTIQANKNNWSRNVLLHQIESKLYERQGKAVTNFEMTLPAAQGDLAKELMKDPYKFDFLNLYDEYKERDLENALLDNLTKFLLELGTGFSFISRQYPLEVGNKEFAIDLLFYHFKLHCFVAVELKTKEFFPEHVGKLNFYLNVLDDTLKQPEDHASIGILICKQHNKVIAEYALRGINKPIGISEYQLIEALPDNLKGILPTIEQIEEELQHNTEKGDSL
jgi:predicted nuclease of restriction endonuclease-like (RecB) superfamily